MGFAEWQVLIRLAKTALVEGIEVGVELFVGAQTIGIGQRRRVDLLLAVQNLLDGNLDLLPVYRILQKKKG